MQRTSLGHRALSWPRGVYSTRSTALVLLIVMSQVGVIGGHFYGRLATQKVDAELTAARGVNSSQGDKESA